MTDLLDTSVLVPYLMGDPPDQAEAARRLIESDVPLAIPVVALAETGYVLTSAYAVDRPQVVDGLVRLLSRANVSPLEIPRTDAVEALLLCRPSNRVSFADALIWAAAHRTHKRRVYTFDRRFPTADVDRKLL